MIQRCSIRPLSYNLGEVLELKFDQPYFAWYFYGVQKCRHMKLFEKKSEITKYTKKLPNKYVYFYYTTLGPLNTISMAMEEDKCLMKNQKLIVEIWLKDERKTNDAITFWAAL